MIDTRGLCARLVTALGGTPRFHTAPLIAQAVDALAAETAKRGRRVVLVLDEAHLLDPAQLAAIRLLSNAEADSVAPFAAAAGRRSPPCAGGSNSASSPRSTSASRCATR